MSDYLLDILKHFVSWLLDPARMLDGASKVLGYLIEFVGHTFFTGPVAARFDDVAHYFNSAPFGTMLGLAAFVASPFITPELFLGCCGIMLNTWIVTLLITLAFTIKGWFTGTGA